MSNLPKRRKNFGDESFPKTSLFKGLTTSQRQPRRAERPRAVSANISYAKMTPARTVGGKNVSNDTSIEDIKALLSVITSIDIGELALFAKKFKAAANTVKKIIVLGEHASFVKAIKNNKILSVQIKLAILYRIGKLDQKSQYHSPTRREVPKLCTLHPTALFACLTSGKAAILWLS
ncbi:hypothetical protein EVAR_21868_1 [Eumeta japonica]|uniref:Uncharacterized protein n=1 Tax=Eumeta variegata TaxID=151549 RepID=A0A4C1V7J9_EUMVA|nr:hypothetical protein EVAR_21868_1 [Eumeta japonica]